jgi:protein TonB
MFDLVTGKARHLPRNPALPIVLSTAAQVIVLGLVVAIPVLFVTEQLPQMPTMMAFVAAPPTPPPPPPPPPAPAPARVEKPPVRPAAAAEAPAFPIEAPSEVAPEPAEVAVRDEEGVSGGVEGGVPGGVVGGVVGGIPDVVPPPPPPPAAPAPRAPVRVGGQIKPPALVHRVQPAYPDFAVQAHIEGTVILEAIVDEEGKVDSVRVLRSVGVLDRAAIAAVEQWRYSPLTLNGRRERFVLTVTLSFNLDDAGI